MTATDKFCEPCSRGNIKSIGACWCSECEEYLCELCERAHQFAKLSQTHQLVRLEELPDIPDTYSDIKYCVIHSGNVIEYFCKFHDDICCKICLIESHRSCEKIKQLDDVSQEIKSSSLVEDVGKAISQFTRTCSAITQSNKENVNAIQDQDKKIRTAITDFKEVVVRQLDVLENSLLSELAIKRDDSLAKLNAESEEVTKMIETVMKQKELYDFTIDHASKTKLFLLVEKLRHAILGHESKMIEFLKNIQTINLNLTTTSNVLSAFASLIAIDVQSEAPIIEYKPVMQCQAQCVSPVYSFEKATRIDFSRYGSISIPGIEITEDDRLLLCHFFGNKILIYKNDGTFVQDKDTVGQPYGIVAVQGKCQVVVTFPNSKLIQVLTTETLETLKSFSTEKKYYGISVIRNVFVAGRQNAVDLLSMNGQVKRTIDLPGDIVRYICHRNNGTFLCSNSAHLFCIDILDDNNVFTYTSTTEARGIAEDALGFIYVADRSQKNVHRVDPDGEFVDIALSNHNKIGIPISMRFSNDRKRMFIGMENSKYLAAFNCK